MRPFDLKAIEFNEQRVLAMLNSALSRKGVKTHVDYFGANPLHVADQLVRRNSPMVDHVDWSGPPSPAKYRRVLSQLGALKQTRLQPPPPISRPWSLPANPGAQGTLFNLQPAANRG